MHDHDINQAIDAILLNNPYAVSQHMIQLGVLQEDTYDVNILKSIIVDATYSFEDGGASFLEYVLDVPVDYNGYNANELIDAHLTNGNKTLLREMLRSGTPSGYAAKSTCASSGSSPTLENWWQQARSAGTYLSLETLVLILAALLMLVLTIAVIKKI